MKHPNLSLKINSEVCQSQNGHNSWLTIASLLLRRALNITGSCGLLYLYVSHAKVLPFTEGTKKQGKNEDLETCKIFFLNFLTFGL